MLFEMTREEIEATDRHRVGHQDPLCAWCRLRDRVPVNADDIGMAFKEFYNTPITDTCDHETIREEYDGVVTYFCAKCGRIAFMDKTMDDYIGER
jgi:hypothetical protein